MTSPNSAPLYIFFQKNTNKLLFITSFYFIHPIQTTTTTTHAFTIFFIYFLFSFQIPFTPHPSHVPFTIKKQVRSHDYFFPEHDPSFFNGVFIVLIVILTTPYFPTPHSILFFFKKKFLLSAKQCCSFPISSSFSLEDVRCNVM